MVSRLILSIVMIMAFVPYSVCGITSRQLNKMLQERISKFDEVVKDLIMEVETTLLREGKEVGWSTSKVFRKANKVRIETTMKGIRGDKSLSSTMVYDGEDAWVITPTGRAIKIEDILKEQIDPARFIPAGAKVLGEEKIDNRNCYVVEYTEFRMAYKLWIDKSRLIPLKMEIGPKGEEDIPPTIILFKDYRKVKGIWGLPFETIVESSPDTIAIYRIKRLKVNKGVDEALFDVKTKRGRDYRGDIQGIRRF